MSVSKILFVTAGLVAGTVATIAVAAEDHGEKSWKREAIERFEKETHKHGKRCQYRVTARGSGPVGLGLTEFWAKRHTTKHWEEEVSTLFSPEYAKWSRARDKNVTCERREKELHCKATGIPCKERD